MKFEKSKIKKILVISLSNIGDCVLTFPVIDILKRDFPQSALSVVSGPKAEGLFQGNPHITRVYVFNKRQPFFKAISWVMELRREKFDLAVDLRNTAIPFLIGAKYKTPLDIGRAHKIHMKQKHLNRLGKVFDYLSESQKRFMLVLSPKDKSYIASLCSPFIRDNEKYIVIAPGAANHLKRWKEEGFAKVADHLIGHNKAKIIFAGDQTDEPIARRIQKLMKHDALNLCGKTTLMQLSGLLERASLVITNDSGIMHMSSYLDIPVVAVFGPTDPVKYSPWSRDSRVVKSTVFCRACDKPDCQFAHECMDFIDPSEVLNAAKGMAENRSF